MWKHLWLASAPVAEDIKLLHLGRINILCGKNNSGKSTVLTAIVTPSARSAGKTFERTEYDAISLRALPGTGWRGEKQHENLVFQSLAARVLSERVIWFRTDDLDFGNKLIQLCREDRDLARWLIDLSPLAAAFRAQFEKDPETVL
jgi:ABC-type phosphate/phosphonate transport system ATPase subunit